MKKLIIYCVGFSILFVGSLAAEDNSKASDKQQTVEVKSVEVDKDLAKLPACCRKSGGKVQCSKKNLSSAKTVNADLSVCCKDKGGVGNCCDKAGKKAAWWKIWKK